MASTTRPTPEMELPARHRRLFLSRIAPRRIPEIAHPRELQGDQQNGALARENREPSGAIAVVAEKDG